jgi:acyl-coenzyme A thioesterase PaaI-like protein
VAENKPSLQDRYAPHNKCFGCGPSNEKGLRIKSIVVDDRDPESEVLADWQPEAYHEAFDDILSGGIIGTLLDCHANWTAAFHLMRRDGQETPPCTVTARFTVRMKHPTPTKGPVNLSARVRESDGNRVTVDATLTADGRVTATCDGVFVAVTEGHPAYRRW